MKHYGIPEKIISIVQSIYQGMFCRVVHSGQISESFEVKTGVRQGCLLSPFLFLLVIDWIMKSVTSNRNNGIQWTLLTQLDDLDFADDLALLSHNKKQMQNKTDLLKVVSEKTGLKINKGKTEVMKINTSVTTPITVVGEHVKDQGSTEISTGTKLIIFNSNVRSVLLYGCETWRTTKALHQKIQCFVNTCLRRILGIRWPNRISNTDLWERAGQEPLAKQIIQRK